MHALDVFLGHPQRWEQEGGRVNMGFHPFYTIWVLVCGQEI